MNKKVFALGLLAACIGLGGWNSDIPDSRIAQSDQKADMVAVNPLPASQIQIHSGKPGPHNSIPGTAPSSDGSGAAESTSGQTVREGYFKLEGNIYQVPMSYLNQLDQYGWIFKDPALASKELYPGEGASLDVAKGNVTLNIQMANLSNEKKPAYDTTIAALQFSKEFFTDTGLSIELPGGLVISQNTRAEDVIAVLGNATDNARHDSSNYRSYWFDIDGQSGFGFSFDETQYNIINSFSLSCSDLLYNKQAELSQSGLYDTMLAPPTPEILAYQAPTALGNEITSGIIEYKGDLYKFPIPVSEFQKNGWKLYASFPVEVEAGGFTSVGLLKGLDEISPLAYNYSNMATTRNNLFISAMGSSEFSSGLVLPGGIKKGSKKSELLAALSGIEYECSEDTPNGSDRYTVTRADNGYVIKIDMDNRSGQIEYIFIFAN